MWLNLTTYYPKQYASKTLRVMALLHFAICFSENCQSFCSDSCFTFETGFHSPSDEVKCAVEAM